MRREPSIFYWHRQIHLAGRPRWSTVLGVVALGVWFGYLICEAAT